MSTLSNAHITQLIHTLQEESDRLCETIDNSQHTPYSPELIESYLSKLVSSTDAVCDNLENINGSIRELNKTVEESIELLVKTLQG